MKFKLHKSNLLEALSSVQGSVGSRPPLPVLSNVLVEARGDELTFTTTDFDITMRTTCKAEVLEEGEITLPLKRLTSIVRELSDQIVEISSISESAVKMSCGSYRSNIMGIVAKEFPPIPGPEDGVSYKLEQSAFKEMLRKTSYAASTDDSRPILTGVLLSFSEGKLTCVATDGRRLALSWMEVDFPVSQERNITLAPRAVSEIMRSLDKGDMILTVKDTQVMINYNSKFFSSKLMNGNYPNYKQIVFTDCENKIKVNREELLSVLRRINVSATPTTNAMRLSFESNLLTIAVTSPDVEEATDTVAIKYDGAPITAIFNPEFMMEPLRNLTSDEITIELNNASSPGLIKDDTTFLYVIMPLRV